MIQIRIGDNLFFNEATDEWMVTFGARNIITTGTVSTAQADPFVAIIIGAVFGVIILLLIAIIVIFAIVIYVYHKKLRYDNVYIISIMSL